VWLGGMLVGALDWQLEIVGLFPAAARLSATFGKAV